MFDSFQKKKTVYTGGFATEDMIHAFDAEYSYPDNSPDGRKNIKLSKHLQIGLGRLENDNILVCADPELEHIAVDRAVMNPYGSYVIFDRTGEYQKRFSQKFAELGYSVLTLDFSDPEGQACYNPFDCLKAQEDIDAFAECFSSSCVAQGVVDPTVDAPFLLIKMLTCYLVTCNGTEMPTMHSLFTQLQAMLPEGIHKTVAELSETEAYVNTPMAAANKLFQAYPDNVRISTIRSIMGMLDPAENQAKHQNSKSIPDLEAAGTKKIVLFIIPGKETPFHKLMSDLLFAQILKAMQACAKQSQNGSLPQYLRLILNGQIFYALWSTKPGQEIIRHSREYGMSYIVLTDQLSDVCDVDGRAALPLSEIGRMFAAFLYLGNQTQNAKTMQSFAAYVSKISAESAQAVVRKEWLDDARKRPDTHKCHPVIRPLMTADELRYLRDGWCVCAIPGKIVVYEERANSFKKERI